MTTQSELPGPWRKRTIGSQPTLWWEGPGVVMVFGLGPATGCGVDGLRVRDAVNRLPTVTTARWCRQVHGAQVVEVAAGGGVGDVGPADALVTRSRECGLVIWTADCVPILVHSGDAVAAVHAGWRGLAAGVVAAAAEGLVKCSSTSPFSAWIGPAVGWCHYPVDHDVVDTLTALNVHRSEWLHSGLRVDLRALAARHLYDLGAERVGIVGGCTACGSDLASFRRDGANAGRQWSMVWRP